MLFDSIEDSLNFAVAALDGLYGWVSETIAIAIFVLVFNFLAKWVLKRLHRKFESQHQVWKDCFVKALYTPLSYFVWFFASFQILELIASRIFTELPIENRHMILAVGATAAFAWFLMRWKRFIVQNAHNRYQTHQKGMDPGKIGAIDKIVTVTIIFFTILILMEVTQRSMNTIIAFGGVGGLALAFASQEIIANFFGGFMIYLTQPFTIGDWILIPDHDIEGYVEDIGWYMTRIRSLDKRPIYIPNSIFSKLIVITPSRMSHRQIKETIGIRCDDLPKMKEIIAGIKEMLQQHPDLDQKQPIIARFFSFGQSSLDVVVNAYTQTTSTSGFMQIKEDVLLKIADVIQQNGAQIATPTQHISILEKL